MKFEKLPDEIQLLIFNKLTRDNLEKAQNVCRKWNLLISENIFGNEDVLRKKIDCRFRSNSYLENNIKCFDIPGKNLKLSASSSNYVVLKVDDICSQDLEVIVIDVQRDEKWEIDVQMKTCKNQIQISMNNKLLAIKFEKHVRSSQTPCSIIKIWSLNRIS